MQWRFWNNTSGVLIVGYSPRNIGGVTKVMGLLCERIPYLQLHVALRCYGPTWKVLLFSIYSVLTFALRLVAAAPRVIQVIVGSRGDALRMLPYIVLGKMSGSRVCLHFHKNRAAIFDGFPGWLRRVILSVWRSADCYCFLSNRLRDEFRGQLDPRRRQVVIPNPISEKWLRPSTLPRGERTRGLVFLGRWSPEKGNQELLSAMRSLNLRELVVCHVYSDYLPRENPENCVFHPWQCEDEIQCVLRESKVLLLPSHAEAYPTVLLEAAACGTPFVAAKIAGIPDIAEESGGGLLHEVGDVEGMRDAITRLLTDEAMWDECSQSGRRWVESLEVSRIVPRWHRLYRDLGVKLQ
jgi:glycosyltransferase involved in cell wall biosynthesis